MFPRNMVGEVHEGWPQLGDVLSGAGVAWPLICRDRRLDREDALHFLLLMLLLLVAFCS